MVALTLILGVVVVHASPLSFLGPDWRGVYVTSPRRRRDLGASTEKRDRQLHLAILSHFPNGAKNLRFHFGRDTDYFSFTSSTWGSPPIASTSELCRSQNDKSDPLGRPHSDLLCG